MKRQNGLTVVTDYGLGIRATEDLVETVGEYVDVVKLDDGSSLLYPPAILARKLSLLHGAGIDVRTGGSVFERYVRDNGLEGLAERFVADHVVRLGVDIVEIATSIVELTDGQKIAAVREIASTGMRVHFEIGHKSPSEDRKLDVHRRIELMRRGLDAGAEKVTVEGRAFAVDVGIYDSRGAVIPGIVDDYLAVMALSGVSLSDVIWEAPLRNQQVELIRTLGPDVNLGNVRVDEVMLLEAFRQGVRFETASLVRDGGMASHGRSFWKR